MPIFEYICSDCGAEFEMLVRNKDEKVRCGKCSSEKVSKKLSVFSASANSPGCAREAVCPSAGMKGCSPKKGCGCGCGH